MPSADASVGGGRKKKEVSAELLGDTVPVCSGAAVLQTSIASEAVALAVLGSWGHTRLQRGSLLLPRSLANPSLALEYDCFSLVKFC